MVGGHTSRRRALVSAPLGALLAGAGAWLALSTGCDSGSEDVERLCVPGQDVFCRCPDGTAATQACNESGMSFGACGPCHGAAESPAGSSASSGSGTQTGGRPMFAPCKAASECATTICADGYCTSPCYKPSDCPYPKAECLADEESAAATCAPACGSDADCSGFGVTCQPGHAIDGWLVKTCR